MFLLKERVERFGKSESEAKSQQQILPRGDKYFLCRACRNRITQKSKRIEMRSRHEHTLFNPQGVVFTVACFSQAAGADEYGVPTEAFSWFEGFFWNYALCAVCSEHLGWFFQKRETESFWGLIVNKLVRE